MCIYIYIYMCVYIYHHPLGGTGGGPTLIIPFSACPVAALQHSCFANS